MAQTIPTHQRVDNGRLCNIIHVHGIECWVEYDNGESAIIYREMLEVISA